MCKVIIYRSSHFVGGDVPFLGGLLGLFMGLRLAAPKLVCYECNKFTKPGIKLAMQFLEFQLFFFCERAQEVLMVVILE